GGGSNNNDSMNRPIPIGDYSRGVSRRTSNLSPSNKTEGGHIFSGLELILESSTEFIVGEIFDFFEWNKDYQEGTVLAASLFFSKGRSSSTVSKIGNKNFNKISDSFLKKSGVDAHKLKKAWLGNKAQIAKFDLYRDKATGEILILQKGGKGSPIHTGEFIK